MSWLIEQGICLQAWLDLGLGHSEPSTRWRYFCVYNSIIWPLWTHQWPTEKLDNVLVARLQENEFSVMNTASRDMAIQYLKPHAKKWHFVMVFVHHSPSFLQHSCLFSPSSPTRSSHPSHSLSHRDVSEHGTSCQRGEGGLSPGLIREAWEHFHTLHSQGLRVPSQITAASSQPHRHKSHASSIETSVSCYIKHDVT